MSDHEYLGGKGRISRIASSSSQPQRKKQKSNKPNRVQKPSNPSSTCTSETDIADDGKSSSSTNMPANYDSSKFPNYKILTMPGYGNLGIRGIQSTSRIDAYQGPILVGCIQDDYKPDALPRELEELEFWVQIKGAIDDVLCDMIFIDCTDRDHWVCSKKLSKEGYTALLEKYPELNDSDLSSIEAIKTGFVNPGAHPPTSLGNGVGREAVHAMLMICRDVVRNRFPEEHLSRTLKVSNVGRGATDYTGNCIIAYYDDYEDLSEEPALDFLENCRLPSSSKRSRWGPKNVKVHAPDVQVCSQHIPTRDFCFLTAGVKSESVGEKNSNEEILQTWLQSLIGLKRLDTAYAVLLTPGEGIILQVHIEEREGKKHKRLSTKKKIWNFIGDTKTEGTKFQTKNFIEFVSVIVGIMLKHKD